VALAILLQRGELCCGVFAGQWTSEEAACQESPFTQDGQGNFFPKDSPYHRWSFESAGKATPNGGFSRIEAFAIVNTNKSAIIEETEAIAKPPKAWAKGSLKKVHVNGIPAHAQGTPLGTYRASARLSLEFSAKCTAEGPTASVAGGGDANASCGVGNTANIGLGGLNIACDSNVSKNWGFNVTLPTPAGGEAGVGISAYKSEIGRLDGVRSVLYLYDIPDTPTHFDNIEFKWECDAEARITAFATPGALAASKSDGRISLKSTVSDVKFEVTHADTRSNSDSESN